MKVKVTVGFTDVKPPIYFAIGVADCIYDSYDKACIVTSLNDSEHRTGIHHQGFAVDLRTKNLTPEETELIFAEIKNRLNPLGFDIVHEVDHIHVEYDPKQGENWIQTVS